MSTRPDKTLGVVTLSANQAETVMNAVLRERRQRPDLEHLFREDDRLNGFFIKPLESVQGNERDVSSFLWVTGPTRPAR
ncbi:hypothetical protein [Catenulispora subtropica]|uniref:Uncharacterized protein n=1 Tax=Catenulispora subtropica TaxID=450798 RepID=A0ABN2QSQ1_9ACTN